VRILVSEEVLEDEEDFAVRPLVWVGGAVGGEAGRLRPGWPSWTMSSQPSNHDHPFALSLHSPQL